MTSTDTKLIPSDQDDVKLIFDSSKVEGKTGEWKQYIDKQLALHKQKVAKWETMNEVTQF